MAYRCFTTIFWPCFVLFTFCRFSNAALPNWCKNPMPIEHCTIHSELMPGITPDISVFLCQLPVDEKDEFVVYDPSRNEGLLNFKTVHVIFQLMSSETFWIEIDMGTLPTILWGRFKHFEHFKQFHTWVNRNPKYSPKKYYIMRVESIICPRGADVDVEVLHSRPAVLSQYFIDERLITSPRAVFAIGDDFVGDNEGVNSYLTFRPYGFRCTRGTIGSQVVITHVEDEKTYFVLRLDSPARAADFARYISGFAIPEPSLVLPRVLERFLGKRT